MHALLRCLAAGSLAALLAATPAGAQDEGPDPYVHAASGIAFPKHIAGFDREAVEEDPLGALVSVDYTVSDADGAMTVRVEPRFADTCREDFLALDESMTTMPPRFTPRPDPAPLRLLPDRIEQFSRVYDLPAGAVDEGTPALVSFLWTACMPGSRWMVTYRGVFSPADAPRAIGLAQRLIAGIDWTPLTGR